MPLPFLTIPILSALISQIVKLSCDGIRGNLTVKHILSDYSGMPSSHSAFVSSLTTLIAFTEGVSSPLFGVSFAFSAIVIRDAIGFRRTLGIHAQRLNMLQPKQHPLSTRIGHSPAEVLVGITLGATVSILLLPFAFPS